MQTIVASGQSLSQKLILIIAVSILLRLIAMPFFMHMDLLSEFNRVNYAIQHGEFYPGFNRLTIFYIESIFYFFTQWFVVNPDVLLYLPQPEHSTADTTTHFIFTGDPYVFRHIFLFKLPYFVFDLLSALLIWKYFNGHRLQIFTLVLWLFNPVTFYATYFFGRFEVISLFFLIWTCFCLKDKRWLTAAIVFGLAINCREINLIFAPAFILAIAKGWRANAIGLEKMSVCFAIVVLFALLPYLIEFIFNVQPLFTREANILEVSNGMSSFFDSKIGFVFPFFLVAAMCYFFIVENHTFSPEQIFVVAGLSVILPFFIGDFKSAHYFTWVMPFLILACYHTNKLVLPSLALLFFWVLYWLLHPSGAHFTLLLATPIDESFFGFKSFLHYWQSHFSRHPVFSADTLKDLFMTLTISSMIVILVRANFSRSN